MIIKWNGTKIYYTYYTIRTLKEKNEYFRFNVIYRVTHNEHSYKFLTLYCNRIVNDSTNQFDL